MYAMGVCFVDTFFFSSAFSVCVLLIKNMHTGAKFLALMTEPFPVELNVFKITKDTN